jgi:hypothetical protein
MRDRPKASLEQLEQRLVALIAGAGRLAAMEEIGRSVQGRPLRLVTIADPAVADDDQQVAFIVTGHHGAENAGPLAALRLIEWLVGPEAADTRARQRVCIVPCVNVDGYVADTYFNTNDVNLDRDYLALGQPESQAAWRAAERLAPDLAVDVHSYGGGYTCEATITHPPGEHHVDEHRHALVCQALNEAAEAAGYPQWAPYSLRGDDGPVRLPSACFDRFHSMCIYIEVQDTTFTPEQAAESGFVRLRRLLQFGNEVWPGERYAGYPMDVIAEVGAFSLVAHGETAAKRRRSRSALWSHRGKYELTDLWPQEPNCFRATVINTEGYHHLHEGLAVRVRIRQPFDLESVRVGSKALPEDPAAGYITWTDAVSRCVQAPIPHPTGCYLVTVTGKAR